VPFSLIVMLCLADAGTMPPIALPPTGAPALIGLQTSTDIQPNSVSIGGVGALQNLGGGSGRVSVSFDSGRGDTNTGVDVAAPATPGPNWIGGKMGLSSNVGLGALGALELSATHVLHQEVANDGRYALGETVKADTTASATLMLPTIGSFSSRIGAQANVNADVSRSSAEASLMTRTDFNQTRVFYAGTFAPAPALSVETGASLVAQSIGGSAGGVTDQNQSAVFSPRVAAIVTPWADAKWSVALERHVDTLNTNDFLAALDNRSQQGRFDLLVAPNTDLRYRAEVRQGLPGGVDASVAIMQTRDGEAVEQLMLSPSLQAPNSVRLDSSQQVNLSVKAPLELAGLSGAVLETNAGWTRSTVVDPLTAERRGLSGEQPFQLSVGLVQKIPATSFSWGVHSAAGGRRTYYGDNSALTVDAPASWDAFLQYQPGRMLIRLKVSGLAGTPSTLTEGRAAFLNQDLFTAFGAGAQSNTSPQLSLLFKTAL
jgi:hypothetical protein